MIIQCMGRLYVPIDENYETWPLAMSNTMTKAQFPYLTPEFLEAHEVEVANWLATLWPEHSPAIAILGAVATLIPLMDQIPMVRAAIQTACNEINAMTGAQPAAV
jgi:hypothetical protein